MITAGVLSRIFRIQTSPDMSGTAFAVDHDGRQYLVTARHVLDGVADKCTIQIFHDSEWKNLTCNIVGRAEGAIDIGVLAPDVQLAPHPQSFECGGNMFVFEEAFFAGFPYGITQGQKGFLSDFPIPFAKKGIISAIHGGKDKPLMIWIDAHNNPGFSGSPVILLANKDGRTKQSVVGVISSYRFEEKPVFDGNDATTLHVQENTGIAISYGVVHAIDLIKSNSIGFELPT